MSTITISGKNKDIENEDITQKKQKNSGKTKKNRKNSRKKSTKNKEEKPSTVKKVPVAKKKKIKEEI